MLDLSFTSLCRLKCQQHSSTQFYVIFTKANICDSYIGTKNGIINAWLKMIQTIMVLAMALQSGF